MNHSEQDQQFCLTLSPEPFCTFCLRASPPNEQFYKYTAGGGFVELRLPFETLLGYDLQLDNFAVCKPCWSLVQLFQDFRVQCQKASGLAERIGQGLRSKGDVDWFGESNLRVVEDFQKLIQGQLAQIERVNESAGDERKIKSEPIEVDVDEIPKDKSKVAETSHQFGQDKKRDFPAPAFHMVEIKVEHYDETYNEESCSNNELLEEMDQTDLQAPDSPNESEEFSTDEKHIKVEPDDENNPASNGTSTLVECEKCSRKFDKLKSMKLHLTNCNGTQPSRLFTCDLCQATFLERRLLNTHKNKHEGKTPFPCRKHCNSSFISAQIRNRHELTCSKDRWKCTLCEHVLPDQMRMFAHYRADHPEELRYPCQTCGKRFKRKDALASHERRLHTANRVKTESCPVCGKMFAELNDLKGHIKLMHEKPRESRAKRVRCELCGKQCSKQNSLNMHMAATHPAQTSEANLAAYRRKCQQNMERKRILKMQGKG